MKKTIVLGSESFLYPTREERREIRKRVPKINRFTIEYKSAMIEILKNATVENATRDEDIYWWNNCLENRLGKLTETYVYILTHFQRIQKSTDCIENKHTDEILLNYYIEIFYYYFFSTRDVLGQLLNLIYELNFKEEKIFLNKKFIEKIQPEEIRDALYNFLDGTKDSYNIRNAFNHRFTPTQTDFKAGKNIAREDNKINFSSAEEVRIEDFIADIENLMKKFSILMNELNK